MAKLPKDGVNSLRQLGSWINENGEGIYETKVYQDSSDKDVAYTQKNGNVYAFYLYEEVPALPKSITLTVDNSVKEVILVRNGQPVPFKQNGSNVELDPYNVDITNARYSDCFKVIFN